MAKRGIFTRLRGFLQSIPDRIAKYYENQPYLVEQYILLSWRSRETHGWIVAGIFIGVMTLRLLSILEHLKRLKVFQIADQRDKPYIKKGLPDLYRSVCIGVLIAILIFIDNHVDRLWILVTIGWCCYRIADIWTDLLYDSLIKGAVRKQENVWSSTRNVMLVVLGYLEITILFGVLYFEPQARLLDLSVGANNSDFILSKVQAIYFSFVTITTLGYGDLSPQSDPASLTVVIQLASGMSLLLIALVRFMSMLRTDTNDLSKS